jgi:hypothetical protein
VDLCWSGRSLDHFVAYAAKVSKASAAELATLSLEQRQEQFRLLYQFATYLTEAFEVTLAQTNVFGVRRVLDLFASAASLVHRLGVAARPHASVVALLKQALRTCIEVDDRATVRCPAC